MLKSKVNLVMSIANDSGNGFTKTFCQFADGTNDITVTPSLYASITENESIPKLEQDLLKSQNTIMDVVLKSPAIKNSSEYLVGEAAINKDSSQSYNVNTNEGKASPDISIILPLTKIAYAALNYIKAKKQSIPSTINVKIANYVTCLPINEFKNEKNRETLTKRFTKGSHTVTIKNVEPQVQVNISFASSNIFIYPEGVIAQIGLIFNPDVKGAYRQGNLYKNSSFKDGKDYLKSSSNSNTLIVDIGDGTTDISIINALQPIVGANFSLNQGVGTAAITATDQLSVDYPQLGHYSRAVFLEHARRNDNEGKILTSKYLEPQINRLSQAILTQIEVLYKKVNNDIDTIVFLGGGINLLSEKDRKFLQKEISKLNPFKPEQKVWWVREKDAQLLNLDGLRIMLLRKTRARKK